MLLEEYLGMSWAIINKVMLDDTTFCLIQKQKQYIFNKKVLFSSRRRHTRLQGDCSSDVCSSDLGRIPGSRPHLATIHALARSCSRSRSGTSSSLPDPTSASPTGPESRSALARSVRSVCAGA